MNISWLDELLVKRTVCPAKAHLPGQGTPTKPLIPSSDGACVEDCVPVRRRRLPLLTRARLLAPRHRIWCSEGGGKRGLLAKLTSVGEGLGGTGGRSQGRV